MKSIITANIARISVGAGPKMNESSFAKESKKPVPERAPIVIVPLSTAFAMGANDTFMPIEEAIPITPNIETAVVYLGSFKNVLKIMIINPT